MVDGGDHVLQLVRTCLEEGVGHAGISLAAGGFPAAVAGGRGAQCGGRSQIGDAGDQNAVPDDLGVTGQNAVVIEEVGRHRVAGSGAVAHIDNGGGHILAHIFLCQRPVLDEHIHFHAMTEGLVGDQTGDGGIGDDIINAGDDGLGSDQMGSSVQQLVSLTGQLCQNIADEVCIGALADLDHLLAVTVDTHHHAVDPGVVLVQHAVGRNEELGNLQGAQNDDGVEELFALCQQCILLLLAEVQQLLFGVAVKVGRTGEGLHQRLIGQIDAALSSVPEGLIDLECGADFGCQSSGVAADVVQGVFKKDLTVADLDHEATLGVHAGTDVGGTPVGGDGAGLDVHAKDAGVGVALFQLRNQSLGALAPGLQKFGKAHSIPSFVKDLHTVYHIRGKM